MAVKQKMAFNINGRFVSTRLLSVYDTMAEPPYFVGLKDKKTAMNCLVITLDGMGYVRDKQSKVVELKENSVYFGNINFLDSLYCKEKWHYLCYWYQPYGKEFPYDRRYIINNIDREKELEDIKEIIGLITSTNDRMIDQANALFTVKIISLLNKIEKNKIITSNVFERMISFINQHLQEGVGVESLVKEFGYCSKHVYYLFKKNLDVAPSVFINRMKLENVCGLLLTTSYTLDEIAEMYNYSSSSHLISNFKKQYGCTPKQFQTLNGDTSRSNNGE